LGSIHRLSTQIVERAQAWIRDQDDAAATATVSARGPAEGYEFLTPKRDGAIATLAGLDSNQALVHEVHDGATIPLCPRRNCCRLSSPRFRRAGAARRSTVIHRLGSWPRASPERSRRAHRARGALSRRASRS